MNVAAIIPAAGAGQRMGGVRKAFLDLCGQPLLKYSLDIFLQHPAITRVVVALAAQDYEGHPPWLADRRVTLVAGGTERTESVRAALDTLPDEVDVVVVHDAARPLVTRELIDRVLVEAEAGFSATVAIPITDTLHEVDANDTVAKTPDRMRFCRAQTPQAFPRDVLELAYATMRDTTGITDEAGLVARGGWLVKVVPGQPSNIKITTPEDLLLVETLLSRRGS